MHKTILHIAQHKTSQKPFVAHQYIGLLTLPDPSILPMETDATYQGCLPSCELHSRSLNVGLQAKFKVRRMRMYECKS